jgi:glyoxylase-like metal-dependent hydrolase (beta-lactamase superfamily II)
MAVTVHHLNCGTLTPPSTRLINGSGRWRSPARLVCHCLLLETDDGLVLVDTGFGLEDIAEPQRRIGRVMTSLVRPVLDPAETAQARIRALGLDPADVTHIVMTHLDGDHAGGLSDFPSATVHASERMLQTISPPISARYSGRLRPAQWEHGAVWSCIGAPDTDFLGVPSSVLPICGGDLRVIPLEGHLPGHIGVAVRREEGRTPWLLHVGDAAFAQRSLTGGRAPAGLTAFELLVRRDRSAWHESRRTLTTMLRRHPGEVEMVTAHDPTGMPMMPVGR